MGTEVTREVGGWVLRGLGPLPEALMERGGISKFMKNSLVGEVSVNRLRP